MSDIGQDTNQPCPTKSQLPKLTNQPNDRTSFMDGPLDMNTVDILNNFFSSQLLVRPQLAQGGLQVGKNP